MKFEVGKKYKILKPFRNNKEGEICIFKQEGFEIYYGVHHLLFEKEDKQVFDLHLCKCFEEDVYFKNHLHEYFSPVDE